MQKQKKINSNSKIQKAAKISYFSPCAINICAPHLPGWFLAERWAVYIPKEEEEETRCRILALHITD